MSLSECPRDDETRWPVLSFKPLQDNVAVLEGLLFASPELTVRRKESVPRQESLEPHPVRKTYNICKYLCIEHIEFLQND